MFNDDGNIYLFLLKSKTQDTSPLFLRPCFFFHSVRGHATVTVSRFWPTVRVLPNRCLSGDWAGGTCVAPAVVSIWWRTHKSPRSRSHRAYTGTSQLLPLSTHRNRNPVRTFVSTTFTFRFFRVLPWGFLRRSSHSTKTLVRFLICSSDGHTQRQVLVSP